MPQHCPPQNPSQIETMFSGMPEDIKEPCPDISWQSSPSAITATITKILQQYFSEPSRMPNQELRNMLSRRIPDITQLDQADATKTGELPKITVNFSSASLDKPAFGQNNQIDYNIHNSTGTYYTVWDMQHKVEVKANNRREALLLIEAICGLFNRYRKPIQSMLAAHIFNVTQIQGPQLDENDNTYISSISTMTKAPEKWYLTEVAPRFDRVNYNLQEE